MSRAPHSAAEDVNLESHCPTGPECSLLAARKERSLSFDGGKAGCNYCLTFQRVSDYALPRCTLEIMKYLCPVSSSPRVPRWSKRKPWSLARTFEPGAASCSGSVMRAVSSFYRTIGLGCSRSMFSAVDALPKGALTVSFKFHLLDRRLVSSLNCIGIKSGNLLSFATTKEGNSV